MSSGRVAGEDEHVARAPSSARARRATASPVPRGSLLHGDLDALERVRVLGRGDDDERIGAERAGRLDHPVDHAPAEQRVEVLRRRRAHARAEARRRARRLRG